MSILILPNIQHFIINLLLSISFLKFSPYTKIDSITQPGPKLNSIFSRIIKSLSKIIMDIPKYSWKRPESMLYYKPSLKYSSSSSKLQEFHSKLMSGRKSPSNLSIPSWKAFKSQIRSNVSPPRFERPKLDHYSDITSFRSSSPRLNGSPLWRSRIRNGSIGSNISATSSPKPMRPSTSFQVIKIEDLRRAIELLKDMDESDISSLPSRYLQEMQEFCRVIQERVKA